MSTTDEQRLRDALHALYDAVRNAESAAHDLAGPTQRKDARESYAEAKRCITALAQQAPTPAAVREPAAPVDARDALTFDAFRTANVARCIKWHPAGIDSWSASDWLVAVTGELGELASLLKMRNRERDGLPGNKFSPTNKMVADELADVLTYLDLLAAALGVDLGVAAVSKFNEVSERVGFPDRIILAALARQAAAPASTAEFYELYERSVL